MSLESAMDEWEKAIAPMKTTLSKDKKQRLEELISYPKPKDTTAKPLKGFKTFTFLDSLYLNQDGTPLGGVPIVGQIGITGLPSRLDG